MNKTLQLCTLPLAVHAQVDTAGCPVAILSSLPVASSPNMRTAMPLAGSDVMAADRSTAGSREMGRRVEKRDMRAGRPSPQAIGRRAGQRTAERKRSQGMRGTHGRRQNHKRATRPEK